MLLLIFSGSGDEFDADLVVGRTYIVPAGPVFIVPRGPSRVYVVPADDRVFIVPERLP